MSMKKRLPSPYVSPQDYARNLGEIIRAIRLRDGRPLEELAPQAGLTPAGWEEVEAGQPPCWELVLLMAHALRLGPSWRPYLARLCAGAMGL